MVNCRHRSSICLLRPLNAVFRPGKQYVFKYQKQNGSGEFSAKLRILPKHSRDAHCAYAFA